MIKNITLEISIWGSVFDARVYLEGNEIKLWETNSSKKIKFRKLPNYSIDDGLLSVLIKTMGKNGSSITLTVKFDSDVVSTVTCVNQNGQGTEEFNIPIN